MSSISSRNHLDRSDVMWWSMAISTGAVVGTFLYFASKTYVPFEYQYRPGTISGWLAGQLSKYSSRRKRQRPIRVYMDGCFDMMHYGHANALRQAKAVGDELVVGLIPDSEILRCKGPPVLTQEERHVLVGAVKWVDEVITDGVPYDLTPTFVEELFTKHHIDYIVHGDDPCYLPDGTDAYDHVKKLGRFKMIKRTEGVSTTNIVGRMLTCTRNPLITSSSEHALALTKSFSAKQTDDNGGEPKPAAHKAAATGADKAAVGPTSRRLYQFSNGYAAPEGARVVYVDGAFDVFHPGHVKLLQAAKALGDYLLVGIHTDEDVSERRGPHLPIMTMHERTLSVLACKHADECIIGAPLVLTEDLIQTFNIALVVRGMISETSLVGPVEEERYKVPKEMSIFCEISSGSDMTARNIIRRIVDQREAYEARNAKKGKSEAAYQGAKTFIKEL